MSDDDLIGPTMQARADWTDTPEQAQLRACLINVLEGHDEADTIRICYEVITLMRDHLMTQVAQVRRKAAHSARLTMKPADLAKASRQSPQTIARLLTESNRT